MRAQNFNDMLFRELQTDRFAVAALFQQRDKLLYEDAPPLRKKYMELIGGTEQKVLEEELEVSMLRRKAELLQIAANRQEKPDPAELEAMLEEERNAWLEELEHTDATLHELPELTEEDAQSLSNLYKQIVHDFHPAVHKDLTETQRELFDRAAEAYRHQDLEAIKLIHDLLYPDPNLMLPFAVFADDMETPEEAKRRYIETVGKLTTDYSLAKKLYRCFIPTQEDSVALHILDNLTRQRRELMSSIELIREGFPFNAIKTMEDPEKTQEYLLELKIRAKTAEREREKLTERVDKLMEGMGIG